MEKLTANELRIGNLIILPTNFPHTKDNTITQCTTHDIRSIVGGNDRYKPIPLTEEWLLKFGFTRHHTDYSNGVIYIKNVPNNDSFVWGVYPQELGSGIVTNDSKELKYVHTLQNLYFALCGEELKIIENE